MHNLFLVYFVSVYMFWAYLGPSSVGTTICIQQLVLIILFRWLSVVGLVFKSDNRQSYKKNNKYQFLYTYSCRGQLKCDGTRAETRFRRSAKRTSPFKLAGGVSSVDYWQPRCAHQLLLLVVMLDTPCFEVVWRVLATNSIRQFPLHFPSRASPCAITFQLESASWWWA